MSNIRQVSEDTYRNENPLYEYDRTMLSEQIATIALALANDEVRALDILLEATVIHYTDWFYEGNLDIDLGFIVFEIGSRFMEQAEYHDEAGLYRGFYIPDSEIWCNHSESVMSSIDGIHRCPECGALKLDSTGTTPRFRCVDGCVLHSLVRRYSDDREA